MLSSLKQGLHSTSYLVSCADSEQGSEVSTARNV